MIDALAINLDAPCWIYAGKVKPTAGYARTSINGKIWLLHRYMWTVMRGPIPQGMHLHHLCREPLCLNPQHMEVVTPRDHLRRGNTFQAANAAKTHCVHGHPFDAENTYEYTHKGYPARMCRICAAERSTKYRNSHLEIRRAKWREWWAKNKDERNARRRKNAAEAR